MFARGAKPTDILELGDTSSTPICMLVPFDIEVVSLGLFGSVVGKWSFQAEQAQDTCKPGIVIYLQLLQLRRSVIVNTVELTLHKDRRGHTIILERKTPMGRPNTTHSCYTVSELRPYWS